MHVPAHRSSGSESRGRVSRKEEMNPNTIIILGQLLKTDNGRERLFNSLVPAMQKRKRVNITTLGKKIAEELGDEAAVWAEECLMEAAKQSNIYVMDGKQVITGTCTKRDDKWIVRTEAGKEYPVIAGNFLTCYGPDRKIYWQGVVDENTPDVETDRPFTLQWDGELVREYDAEEDHVNG